jgi:hypothetical protein
MAYGPGPDISSSSVIPAKEAVKESGEVGSGALQFDPASFDWAPSAPAQDEVNL